LDHLRQGIGLRAYAQKDPLNEYKREAFGLFEELLTNIGERVTMVLSHVELRMMPPEGLTPQGPASMTETHEDPALAHDPLAGADPQRLLRGQAPAPRNAEDASTWGRVGRNEPCPCGSGKKFKQCHGKVS
jgi:preprotein translocase subunit SecA